MMKKTVLCLLLFSFAFSPLMLVSCDPDVKQTETDDEKDDEKDDSGDDKKEEGETVSSADVKIRLKTSGINNVTFSALETYSYCLTLTGGDPYVYSQSLASDLEDDHLMLSFEYKTDKAISSLQIFYALKGVPSEASSKTYSGLEVNSSYRTFAVNISDFREAGWGKTGDCLRFDPGNDGGVTLYVRNIVIRAMSDAEKKERQDELDAEAAKEQMAKNLDAYLSATYSSSVADVSVTSEKVTIKGSCGGSGAYVLADITPWQDVTELKTYPYTEIIKDKSFSITLNRYVTREGITYDRVFSKWAVIKVDSDIQTLDSHARYADDVAVKSSPDPVTLRNKKGLGAGDSDLYFQDCDQMGVGSVTMNVLLNGFINETGPGYSYGGISYAVNSSYQQYIDDILSNASGRGIVVSAIILTPVGSAYKDPECTGGYYSMPNITTAQAFNMYAAALEYMASRYCASNSLRISHWIMHNEVDMASDWTNMGDQPLMRLLDRYVKSMRICYNIVRQYDQKAAILGSYTHNWTQADGGYAPKTMLEKTVEYSKAEGDFWWGLAYHPYAQDLKKPEFWKNDTQATYSMSTKYVTFKNLEVIDKWIKLPENLYQGATKRWLFLSEQGTNSPSYSDADLALQAAGGAWAWKKLAKLNGIDAIQWHNWADNAAEFGLRIGLRTYAEGSYANLSPKPVWYVWKAGGTSDESAVFDPYLSTIGISSWDDIFHDVQ